MLLQGNMYDSETARQRQQESVYDSDAPMLQSALQQVQKLQYLALLTNAISEAGEEDLAGQRTLTRGCAEVRSVCESCEPWLCSRALPAADEPLMGRCTPSADASRTLICLLHACGTMSPSIRYQLMQGGVLVRVPHCVRLRD